MSGRLTWAAGLAAVSMAVSGVGVAAPAQADPGAENTLALEALHNFALCAVKRTPEGAVHLLAMDHTTPAYGKALMRYAKGHDYCSRGGTRLAFGGLPFAGDLAEAVISVEYADRSIQASAAALDAQRSMPGAPGADGKPGPVPSARTFAATLATTTPEAVGLCVTMQKPAAVEALLKSAPNSPEELAALQQTGSVLPGCVPEGVTMKFNRPAVRAIYALGAYRLLAGPNVHAEG